MFFGFVAFFYMRPVDGGWWRPFLATTAGVILAILIDRLTDYFTGSRGAPVKEIKNSADTGPATLILSGVSVGFEPSVWSILVIAATIFTSILIFGGISSDPVLQFTYILYGVAMTGIGMLTLTGNNVAMDSFGPISDNANVVGEMSWHDLDDPETRAAQQIMANLDAVGNTTKAITKGVAIASAVIAAVSLFASYITDVGRVQTQLGIAVMGAIRVSDTRVFIGVLLGGALPWLFASLSIRSVSRAAGQIVEEVRRQFKIPGIMEGTRQPDYASVVGISTASAQKELIPLATISASTPPARATSWPRPVRRVSRSARC